MVLVFLLALEGCKTQESSERQQESQIQGSSVNVEVVEEFDYTGGSLLSTTEIKWLTMEVGGTVDEVRFNWFSKSALTGIVEWREDSTKTVQKVEAESAPSINREEYYVNKACITGLKPGETYTYRVGNTESWSPEYTYQAPENIGDKLTFLVTSDAQLGQSSTETREKTAQRWDMVLTKAMDAVKDAQFLLHLGDHVACFGSGRDYELFLDHMSLYSIPLAPVVGNHDVPNIWSVEESGYTSGPYFYEQLNVPNLSEMGQTGPGSRDGNYYFVRGNVLFVMLNDECADIEEHVRYVKEIVAEYPEVKWRILAKHYPAFQGVESADSSDSKSWVVGLAEDCNFDLVLTGHEHAYSRTGFIDRNSKLLEGYNYEVGGVAENPEGVLYITCSTSSGCLYHDTGVKQEQIVYHGQPEIPMIMQINVTDAELKIITYLAEPWSVFDEYTIMKD